MEGELPIADIQGSHRLCQGSGSLWCQPFPFCCQWCHHKTVADQWGVFSHLLWAHQLYLRVSDQHNYIRLIMKHNSKEVLVNIKLLKIFLKLNSAEKSKWILSNCYFFFRISMMPGRTEFVSCGEDRSVRIWKLDSPDECHQTIFLPAQSIWTVSVMNNNDIITGSR